MVKLDGELANVVRKELGIKDKKVTEFKEEDLKTVTQIRISRDDLELLKYFPNVSVLDIDLFPSILDEDLIDISNALPNVSSLKIKEQNDLYEIDLSTFTNIKEIALIHNDNLRSFKIVKLLDRFTFYDNKDFNRCDQIVSYLINNPDAKVTLDIAQYIDTARLIYRLHEDSSLLSRITWVECSGLRKYSMHQFTNDEIVSLMGAISSIASKYIYVSDGEIEKFGILYKWMINNVSFVNEDEPNNESASNINNIYKVFNFRKGGRLSYAKAFQILLSYVGIESTVVYSYGARDEIGYYNGKKVYSLLGDSDYALLRVKLDGRYYYTDVAWDSMISKLNYFDELRLLLISKDELKLRHKLVGEDEITKSYSYNGDDSDDLIVFANDRINEVDKLFTDIERYDSSIYGLEIDSKLIEGRIEKLNKEKNEPNSSDKTIEGELEDLNHDLDENQAELHRINNYKQGIFDSYAEVLKSRYLYNQKYSNEEIKKDLDNRKALFLISDYVYNILVKIL
jgi:hypothetical protein